MEKNLYFEELCSSVFGYYGMLRNVDPKKHALVMLRSMGEFWSEDDLDEFFSNRKEGRGFLNFLEFRRLAKSKWYEPQLEDKEDRKQVNNDGYGNEVYIHSEDMKKFEDAFNGVSKFYTCNEGPNKTLPTKVLFNILTNFEEPMPKRVADYLFSNLHVYNNAVTARSLLCLLGRREELNKLL